MRRSQTEIQQDSNSNLRRSDRDNKSCEGREIKVAKNDEIKEETEKTSSDDLQFRMSSSQSLVTLQDKKVTSNQNMYTKDNSVGKDDHFKNSNDQADDFSLFMQPMNGEVGTNQDNNTNHFDSKTFNDINQSGKFKDQSIF